MEMLQVSQRIAKILKKGSPDYQEPLQTSPCFVRAEGPLRADRGSGCKGRCLSDHQGLSGGHSDVLGSYT